MDVEGRSAPPGNSSLKNGCGPGPPWSGPAAVSADYSWLLDAVKAEGSALTIYSNTDKENRAPILRDFKAKYPWTKAPADMLVSVMAYDSPETEQLPEFAGGTRMPGAAWTKPRLGPPWKTAAAARPKGAASCRPAGKAAIHGGGGKIAHKYAPKLFSNTFCTPQVFSDTGPSVRPKASRRKNKAVHHANQAPPADHYTIENGTHEKNSPPVPTRPRRRRNAHCRLGWFG